MKYVLINKSYEVIDEVDSVTPGGAEHYFMGRKQIKDKDKIYRLAAEIEAEAMQMKLDYENHPSDMSGSIVVVHEKSEYLDEEE